MSLKPSKTKKIHISLKKIFYEYYYDDSNWLELIKKYYEPEAQFLYLLTPCITYIYEKISAIKLKKFALLEQDNKDIILRRFKNHWLHKIIMCCVLELNDAKELKLLIGETPEKRFESFIELLADNNNRLAFFDKYTVLKEKIQQYLVQEVEALTEILTRLDKCFDEISVTFSWKKEKYTLKNIQSSGDSHGSRNVCILVLSNGAGEINRIVYKPRALLMDKAYHEFLEWLNPNLKIPLYFPKLLLKRNYGWCEFISNFSCKNLKEIKDYYRNLGNLLAVIYLLNGSDIHYENIIAFGKHPIIIDVECLLIPRHLLKQNLMPFQEKMYSVLNTLLLPCRVMVKKGFGGIDISGFTNQINQEAPYQAIVTEESGTDNIRLVRKTMMSINQNNIPHLQNKVIKPINYDQYVVAGFTEAYTVFLNKKKIMLSKNSPLSAFKNARTRLVFRPTAEYTKLLIESYHPALLYKKAIYKKHFSSWLYEKKSIVFLHDSEVNQILQGDVPAYYTMVDSKTKLEDAYLHKVNTKFDISAYEQVMYHIRIHINENDLKAQLHFIDQSFICYKKNINKLPIISVNKNLTSIFQKTIRNNAEYLLNEILNSVWQREDLLFWPKAYSTYKIWNVGVTTPWVYDGLAGIALVFGVASHILNNRNYNHFTINCLKSITLYINQLSSKNNYLSMPIGAFSGVGGVLYIIQILENMHIKYDFRLLKNNCFSLLKKYLPSMKISSIAELDIISGVAGLLKILINFKGASAQGIAFELAHICVKYILYHYPDPSVFQKNMLKNSNIKKPLLGFSHGVSGIAWALYYYYIEVKKSKKIYTWIENALAYERRHFSNQYQNWPHLEDLGTLENLKDCYPVKWCHGAVGIGFSRIDMYRQGWRDAHIVGEIEAAIQTTLSLPPTRQLNLCHGTLGNLEFLEFAVKCNFLNRVKYDNYIKKFAPNLTSKKNFVTEGHEKLFLPGVMTGKAGVAYSLIRIIDSDLPSILLLDKIHR